MVDHRGVHRPQDPSGDGRGTWDAQLLILSHAP
jgi:hypothetical protein